MTAPTSGYSCVVSGGWTIPDGALLSMLGELAQSRRITGGHGTEHSFVLAVDFEGKRFHSPVVAFRGNQTKTHFPVWTRTPGGLLLHTHPAREFAIPSDGDLECAERYGQLDPSLGFAVASENLTSVYLVRAPEPPGPPIVIPRWSFHLGRWLVYITRFPRA
jgi:hypothetical protein